MSDCVARTEIGQNLAGTDKSMERLLSQDIEIVCRWTAANWPGRVSHITSALHRILRCVLSLLRKVAVNSSRHSRTMRLEDEDTSVQRMSIYKYIYIHGAQAFWGPCYRAASCCKKLHVGGGEQLLSARWLYNANSDLFSCSVSGRRAEDKKRLYPVKVDATEASDATATSIVQKNEQADLSTEEDPISNNDIPKEDADASSKSTQQSMGRNSELRPHPFIGQSLMIDDSIAEKIISNAAHAFMHPRKPKLTPRRQTLGGRGTFTENGSDWQYVSDGPDEQADEVQDSNQKDSLPIGRALSEAPSKDYWATVWKDVKVCDDTCPENSDGFCQDGREADGKVRVFFTLAFLIENNLHALNACLLAKSLHSLTYWLRHYMEKAN